MSSRPKVTKQQLLTLIDELETNPADRVRSLSQVGITAAGLGLGAAAAGTVATIAGATSIPVLTSAASWIGVTAVAATPVGWIIGIAAAGGALAYGLSHLVRDGGISEGRKKELLQVYRERLLAVEYKERANTITIQDRTQFIAGLRELLERDALRPEKAFQLIEAVERGAMPVSEAYKLIAGILSDR
ncbi:MAG: hypothetical protein RBS05_10175 [Zoogloea oleivorans]|jgi:hypothetical protein|uniref:hypothetical protein n=1 Tax=Zoogloea oleivorans TaxID=1552750 RepID=UPI002A36AEB4|nr:hypothetical protein [Zoogloea oleivorans]MDY0036263.1 hypothetical protein [Zoogloea oleivorans]